MVQPFTQSDLCRGETVVKALHGIKGFEAWAERIAKEIAAERERCAKIADATAECHRRGGSMSSAAEDIWGVATAKTIAKAIRGS